MPLYVSLILAKRFLIFLLTAAVSSLLQGGSKKFPNFFVITLSNLHQI